MAHDVPMLADFGVRLGFGLAAMLLVTSWRDVPLAFFRTHCYVILAMLVLATLDAFRSGFGNHGVLLALARLPDLFRRGLLGAGIAEPGRPSSPGDCGDHDLWLGHSLSRDAILGSGGSMTLSRMVSGLLIGSTLTAMLLGHHYLTAPTMSIQPLERVVRFMGWSLGLRGLLALVGLLGSYAFMHWRRHRHARSRLAALSLDALGNGFSRSRARHGPGLEDRADQVDPVGDRHPLRGPCPGALRRVDLPHRGEGWWIDWLRTREANRWFLEGMVQLPAIPGDMFVSFRVGGIDLRGLLPVVSRRFRGGERGGAETTPGLGVHFDKNEECGATRREAAGVPFPGIARSGVLRPRRHSSSKRSPRPISTRNPSSRPVVGGTEREFSPMAPALDIRPLGSDSNLTDR